MARFLLPLIYLEFMIYNPEFTTKQRTAREIYADVANPTV
jgi:hypothetical protein